MHQASSTEDVREESEALRDRDCGALEKVESVPLTCCWLEFVLVQDLLAPFNYVCELKGKEIRLLFIRAFNKVCPTASSASICGPSHSEPSVVKHIRSPVCSDSKNYAGLAQRQSSRGRYRGQQVLRD